MLAAQETCVRVFGYRSAAIAMSTRSNRFTQYDRVTDMFKTNTLTQQISLCGVSVLVGSHMGSAIIYARMLSVIINTNCACARVASRRSLGFALDAKMCEHACVSVLKMLNIYNIKTGALFMCRAHVARSCRRRLREGARARCKL